MNRPEPDVGKFANKDYAYLDNDEVPDTLIAALKHFAVDFVPESRAACNLINQWLDENKATPALTEVERGLGNCEFDVDGTRISAMAQPFRFYVLKRVQDEYDALDEKDRRDVDSLLATCDMRDVLDMRLSRAIGRHNNLEVWL